MKLILFDIDGTLIDSGGAGTRAMDTAFEELFSVRSAFKEIRMDGKTDPQIINEGLRLHGVAGPNGAVPEFYSIYLRHLRNNIYGGGHIKKGVREALDALCSRDNYVMGLLTGNIEEGARIKLERFGLDSYFSLGVFGSDDEDRNRLLPLAIDKLYGKTMQRVAYSDCVVIGDTPRDIECSKPYGALAIAVATGSYPSSVLAEAGADVVLDDLSDTDSLMSILEQR
jgi:phosphoglycolate phosphatase-like HAD superfamily hydrolase